MRPNKFRIKAAVDAAAQRDKTMRCFMAMAPSSHLLYLMALYHNMYLTSNTVSCTKMCKNH
ncbi:hypothetical protein GS458_0726 [Geobacillus stearothermophilus]|nr:hypothetical protein GS458_0726 [Geobacillus stearothermophilus]